MTDWREIRTPADVTQAHVEEAADMREGLYGGQPLDWDTVVRRLEGYDEDWGDSMESPAIKYLQQQVRKLLRERA